MGLQYGLREWIFLRDLYECLQYWSKNTKICFVDICFKKKKKTLIFILIPYLNSHTVNDFKCNNVSYLIHELEG